jgi:nucleoid-associated protein YgaU
LARVAAALKGPINEREAVALLAELEAEKAALEAEKVTLEADKAALEADKAALEAEGAAKMARLAAQLDAMTAAHARRAELILVVETWWTILASCTAALYIHMLLRTQYWDPLAQARLEQLKEFH